MVFSAIMIVGALVLPDISSGMIEASTTQSLDAAQPQALTDHGERAHSAGRGRMIGSRPGLAAELKQVLIARDIGSRMDLASAVFQRGRRQNLAQNLEAVDERAAIGFSREIVDANFRRHGWVGALDARRAAALGAQLADRGGEAGERMQLLAYLVSRERNEVDLDVRRRQARTGLEEGARVPAAIVSAPLGALPRTAIRQERGCPRSQRVQLRVPLCGYPRDMATA